VIPPELEAEILRLHHAEGWPVGTLARQLHVHHGTVRRVLEQAGITIAASRPRPSMIDPFAQFIQETFRLYPTLRASRLYQMARERGYRGGPDHFRHMVARWRPRPAAEAYLRLRTLAGPSGRGGRPHDLRLPAASTAGSVDTGTSRISGEPLHNPPRRVT
jgi:hypothetical protein